MRCSIRCSQPAARPRLVRRWGSAAVATAPERGSATVRALARVRGRERGLVPAPVQAQASARALAQVQGQAPVSAAAVSEPAAAWAPDRAPAGTFLTGGAWSDKGLEL